MDLQDLITAVFIVAIGVGVISFVIMIVGMIAPVFAIILLVAIVYGLMQKKDSN